MPSEIKLTENTARQRENRGKNETAERAESRTNKGLSKIEPEKPFVESI
jgi:hypothetical protein